MILELRNNSRFHNILSKILIICLEIFFGSLVEVINLNFNNSQLDYKIKI